MNCDRPTLALPNATYALRTALLAVGVRPDDDVLLSALDWPAGRAAAHSIGANPVQVEPDPATLTISATAAAAARTPRTRAVIATHLFGICADIPALRDAVGHDLPLVGDAAQAFGATLDALPSGALGDIAVYSFGPGKTIDAGELAVLTARDDELLDQAVRHSQHPVRQLLRGLEPIADGLIGRPAPLSALLAAFKLHRWPARCTEVRNAEEIVQRRLSDSGQRCLAAAPRRAGAPGCIAIMADSPESLISLEADYVLHKVALQSLVPRPRDLDWLEPLLGRVRLLQLSAGTPS
jgi:dTDP-4-amino-4,6-dideoxygalactose transaminase